jgi:uncharacterized membrane protein
MSDNHDSILEPDSVRYANPSTLPDLNPSDLLFNATLYPHRSMTPRGARTIITIVGVICALAGLRFIIVGAWPVVLFVMFDVIALWIAFHFNFRAARLFETIQLTKQSLVICRVHPNRQVETWGLEPYWLRILIERYKDNDALQIISHGKKLEIGAFLTDREKQEIATSLQSALKTWRRQEFDTT